MNRGQLITNTIGALTLGTLLGLAPTVTRIGWDVQALRSEVRELSQKVPGTNTVIFRTELWPNARD